MTITITVTLTREAGKFASKEEVAEALIEMLDDVDGVGADGDSLYVIEESSWD